MGYIYRAVGGYLQGVFESLGATVQGRQEDSPRVGIDHTLRGKTRKEAARLFFETLVCPFKTSGFYDHEFRGETVLNSSIQTASSIL